MSVRDFVSFLRRKHDFTGKISTFVWRILRIWISGFNLRTRVLKSLTAAQERDMLDMHSNCHPAKILPAGVGGTRNIWCLSSLLGSLGKGVFERRTSTRSEILFISNWLDNANSESLSYYRDDLSKPLGKITAQGWKKSLLVDVVAQKSLCLCSLWTSQHQRHH